MKKIKFINVTDNYGHNQKLNIDFIVSVEELVNNQCLLYTQINEMSYYYDGTFEQLENELIEKESEAKQ